MLPDINTTSTFDSLRASICTSCTIQDDKSGYWTPYMYYQKADGTFLSVKNGGITIYYLGRGEGTATAFPAGFRMLSGSPGLRSYDSATQTYSDSTHGSRPIADRVSFKCLDYADINRPETPGFPANMTCPQGLRAQIQFPSCWDGQNLYKTDQSHVAYLSQIDNGICPPTYPVLLPHLFYEMTYNLDSVDTSDGGRFLLATGDTTGYGYHGDFMNGWNPNVQSQAVASCLASSGSGQIEDCPVLNASNDPNSPSNCPLQPALVDEQIAGSLNALPGCNPPTSGPGRVNQQLCPGKLLPPTTSTDGQTRQAPTPGSTMTTLSSGSKAVYAGCYIDQGPRALSGASYTDGTSMTTSSCGAFCQSKGFNIFGTEYAAECYCGDAITTSNSSQSDCNMICKGSLAEYCGGPNRLSVWSITSSNPSTTSSFASRTTTTTTVSLTTTSSPSATPSILLANATYLGCYTDSVSSCTLSGYYSNSQSQTLQSCRSAAEANSYKYFGLEYSGECFAGNTISPSSSPGSVKCNMPCSGNNAQICGGSNALSMFQSMVYVDAVNKASVQVSNGGSSAMYEYQGCWTDSTSARTLGDYSFAGSSMSVESCVSTCFSRGYGWAGAEYASECYCGGNGLQNGATKRDDGECSMRCAGDKGEWCGAGNRLSVYKKRTTAKRFGTRSIDSTQ